MAIEFKQEQIEQKERRTHEPYIGYFAPNGELIDYNIMFGANYHDAWQNPVSWTFISFISYIIKGTSIKKMIEQGCDLKYLKKDEYDGIDEVVKRGYDYWYNFNTDDIDVFINNLNLNVEKSKNYYDSYGRFKYELLLFFKNAYSDKKFFDAIDKKIYVENKSVIDAKTIKRCQWDVTEKEKEDYYRDYLKKELMQYFKDISVQFLGYDSLERFTSDNRKIKIPGYYKEWDFDFISNPRVITSSYANINERYYNYLLMNWRVDRLPRYVFNEKTKCYEIDKFFSDFESEKEEILENEIKSIKKLVPLNERYKYFR